MVTPRSSASKKLPTTHVYQVATADPRGVSTRHLMARNVLIDGWESEGDVPDVAAQEFIEQHPVGCERMTVGKVFWIARQDPGKVRWFEAKVRPGHGRWPHDRLVELGAVE